MQIAEPSPLGSRAAEPPQNAAHPHRTDPPRADHGLHDVTKLHSFNVGQVLVLEHSELRQDRFVGVAIGGHAGVTRPPGG